MDTLQPVLLQTKRLNLRPLGAQDLPRCRALWRAATGHGGQAGHAVFALLRQKQQAGQVLFWLLELKANGAFIGSCELNNIDRANRCADIGCALLKSCQKQGYMQEALHAVLAYAWLGGGFSALWANVRSDNPPSRRLFAKLGFEAAARAPNPLAGANALSLVLRGPTGDGK